jgi:DNA polymerase
MIFYDFETFEYDWLVVLKNPENKTTTKIHNDVHGLLNYYENNKNDIWVGYNSRSYDQFILKSILCGFNPKKMNDWIIVKGKSGWQFNSMMREFPVLNYDVMTTMHSLKQLEGYMGNNIHETSVPFDIKRPLTATEIEETFKYCEDDVDNLIEVFIERINDFNSAMDLIKTFNLNISNISKTKAQMSALILECEPQQRNDEWDISIVPTLRLNKYSYVKDWFLNNKGDYTKNLETTVAGVPHVFGWGGLHGAKEKYHGKGLIIHVDVTSYYPSLMIKYNLLTRNCKHPEKFKEIYDKRVQLKKEGKKKEQAPYKIVLNGTYGICKDKYSTAYDPRQANNVCINGQLLLLDLIEKLEVIDGFELIQSNTDGLIIRIPDTDYAFNQVDDICYEWESRTGMGLGFDYIKEIHQKDVNNYIFIDTDNKLERKGAYVKEASRLDNDLPILNTALVNYMAYNIPVEKTINECTDLIQFQKIVRVSSKYKLGAIGYGLKESNTVNKCKYQERGTCSKFGKLCPYKCPKRAKCFEAEYTMVESKPHKVLDDKTFRVFASTDPEDGYIGKMKDYDATLEKFANTPDHMFILNGDIKNTKIPNRLDKQYYIDLAKKRLNDFGVII